MARTNDELVLDMIIDQQRTISETREQLDSITAGYRRLALKVCDYAKARNIPIPEGVQIVDILDSLVASYTDIRAMHIVSTTTAGG